MPRPALLAVVLLSTACARPAPGPLTLAVEATLGCVVGVLESRGFREESSWRQSGRSTISVRFTRAGEELTVTLEDHGQGLVSINYGTRGGRGNTMDTEASLLRTLVRNRCFP